MNRNRHTEKTEPRLMDMAAMNELLMPNRNTGDEHFFLNDEIGILHGNPKLFRLVIQQNAPFVIDWASPYVARESPTSISWTDRFGQE